jgi:hypothetical protein
VFRRGELRADRCRPARRAAELRLFAAALGDGAGGWVTVYGNAEYAYREVAGLRLDTSAFGDTGGRSGVRWRPAIGARIGFVVSHPARL